MPRASRFTDDDVLDAARTCVGRDGRAATIADVAAALDGPVGSIYHRFASREEVLARLWLRSVERFQSGLFALADERLGLAPQEVLVAMARHVPAYCRAHRDEARALTLYRQARLLDDCPTGLEGRVRDVNLALDELTVRLCRQRYGSARRELVRVVVTATRLAPYGLVRPYVGGQVPRLVDDAVGAAAGAILDLGDR